jgi:hypothetical protein
MHHWLKQLLGVWLWESVRLCAIGFLLWCIGIELEIECLLIAGVVLCYPLIALGQVAIFLIIVALVTTAVIVPLRLVRKLTLSREESWKTPASFSATDMWDAEVDGY